MFAQPATVPGAQPEGPVAWEFQHPHFVQNRPDLLGLIKRKPSKSGASNVKAISSSSNEENRVYTARAHIADLPALVTAPRGNAGYGALEYGPGAGMAPTGLPAGYGVREPIRAQDYASTAFPPGASMGQFPNALPHNNAPLISPRHTPGAFTNGPNPAQAQYIPNRPVPMLHLDSQMMRQVTGLDQQVRGMSESLYRSQQDGLSARSATYTVLRMLLGLVADLDPTGARHEERESLEPSLCPALACEMD